MKTSFRCLFGARGEVGVVSRDLEGCGVAEVVYPPLWTKVLNAGDM